MIGLLQRVSAASVVVNEVKIADISQGLLIFLGVEKSDTHSQLKRLLEKSLSYRIFEDDDGNMNRSVIDLQGDLLVVPQFTLAAQTSKGLRPGFSDAALPNQAEPLFQDFVKQAKSKIEHVEAGEFGADMKVHLINDGPCTFWLQVK